MEDDDRIEFFEPDGISSFRIGKDVFDKTDFEIIREIIIEQNSLSPHNHKLDKVLREKMEEVRCIKIKPVPYEVLLVDGKLEYRRADVGRVDG